MSFLDEISVLILTYNEAPNIGRTLHALRAFSEIVILDSHSTDSTVEIVSQYANARLVTRSFDNHASQWNYGLTACGIERPWVLALDADHLVPGALLDEIARLSPSRAMAGYRVPFRYCVGGRRLSGSLYSPITTLYQRDRAYYIQSGHTQRVVIDGAVGDLTTPIDHDDRKPLRRWFSAQQRYAELEACYLLGALRSNLRRTDRLRLTGWAAPVLIFPYTLLWKRCILDGWVGWFYVLQRTLAETMIALELFEQRLRRAPQNTL
jgi:glycosyltransferase involved in cell wall biosynthesis